MLVGRRRFLSGVLGAATVVACRSEDGQPPTGSVEAELAPLATNGEFPLGVASGDVTDSRITIWTRYVGTAALHLQVIEVEEPSGFVTVVDQPVTLGPDGFTHIEVENLKPGKRHRYIFLMRDAQGADIARSFVGDFKTALAEGSLEVVTFGGTACTSQPFAPFPTLLQAVRKPLDFMLHAGDKVYCDGAKTLEEYRAKYVTNWTAQGMSLLHARTAWYTTWDDHEVADDWNAETFDRVQLAAATQAYFEHNPIRRHPENRDRLWRSFRWGHTAEIFLLDSRGERKPSTRTTAEAEYLSHAQAKWLEEGLASSPAVFKFIVNSVPIADYPAQFTSSNRKRWPGYAAQRDHILGHILERDIKGVFWLSGDLHAGGVGRIGPEGSRYAAMPEIMMGPGGQSGFQLVTNAFTAPQWDFVTTSNNVTVFRADPVGRTLDVDFLSGTGQSLFTTQLAV